MSTADKNLGRVVTPEARLIYPHLFKPHQMTMNGKPKGDPRFEVELLFDPSSIDAMKQKALAVARAKWPGRELSQIRFPFKKGEAIKAEREAKGKKGFDYYNGMISLRASSTHKPKVVDHQGEEILDEGRVYGGCYGYAELNFVAWDGNGDNIPDCVTVYLNMIMKSRDGERLGGGRYPKEVFSGVIGKDSQEDPTAGLDDELPF